MFGLEIINLDWRKKERKTKLLCCHFLVLLKEGRAGTRLSSLPQGSEALPGGIKTVRNKGCCKEATLNFKLK